MTSQLHTDSREKSLLPVRIWAWISRPTMSSQPSSEEDAVAAEDEAARENNGERRVEGPAEIDVPADLATCIRVLRNEAMEDEVVVVEGWGYALESRTEDELWPSLESGGPHRLRHVIILCTMGVIDSNTPVDDPRFLCVGWTRTRTVCRCCVGCCCQTIQLTPLGHPHNKSSVSQ